MVITAVSDEQGVNQLLKQNNRDLKVLYFYVDDSAECNQMTDVIDELDNTDKDQKVTFIKINAKTLADISKRFEIDSVPAFLFHKDGNVIDKLIGANVPLLSKKLTEQKEKIIQNDSDDLDTRLKALINKAPVMLFMKGCPDVPRCGFSKQVITLLNSHNAKYETFDILEDWDVREGLKKFSNWPTYPQLYIDGELIGGLDILKELSANGELGEMLSSFK